MAKFREQNFGVSTFKFNRWSLELTEIETVETVMDQTAWANIVPRIMGFDKTAPKGRGDIVEVRKLDTGLYAEFIILEIGAGYVKLAPIRAFEPKVEELPDSVPFVTRWNVGKRTHEVLRRSDNIVMKGDFQSKAAAVEWITNHMKAVAA